MQDAERDACDVQAARGGASGAAGHSADGAALLTDELPPPCAQLFGQTVVVGRFVVAEGDSLDAQDCVFEQIAGARTALLRCGGALVLQRCTVRATSGRAIVVARGATLSLRQCTVEGTLHCAGGALRVEHSTCSGGVVVSSGGTATLCHCNVDATMCAVACLGRDSTLCASDTRITSAVFGACAVMEGGLVLRRCNVSECFERALLCVRAASVHAEDCTLADGSRTVQLHRSPVRMERCSVSGARHYGIVTGKGSALELHASQVVRCGQVGVLFARAVRSTCASTLLRHNRIGVWVCWSDVQITEPRFEANGVDVL